MTPSRIQTFLFTQDALEAGHSIDFVSGSEVLLHIKPVLEKLALVVNDRRGPVWGHEMRITLAAMPIFLKVELLLREDGVEIGLLGQERHLFTRCGDLRHGAMLKLPPAIQVLRVAAVPAELELAPMEGPPTAVQAEPESNAGTEYIAAQLLAQAVLENWSEVLALAESHRNTLPRRADITTALGRAQLQLGHIAEAASELDWLRHGAPDYHPGLFQLGLALARLQRLEEARAVLMQCVTLRGREAKYAFELARVTGRLVNGGFGVVPPRPDLLDEAIELLGRAAALMVRDGRPHRDLAGLLMQKNLLPEALAALDEAQRRSPQLSMLAIERARILVRLDRIEEALDCAREARTRDPQNDTAASTVRVLERWLAARRNGPFMVGQLAAPVESQIGVVAACEAGDMA